MVSMKPGSGTLGLDPDFDDNAGSPAVVERRRKRRAQGVGDGDGDGAGVGFGRETTGGGLLPQEGTGTRYGGPPPGTRGPWRWGQLAKGSALEKACVL